MSMGVGPLLGAEGKAKCGGHEVTARGTAGNDVLRGTIGNDVIAGGQGNDRIIGRYGRDILCGGPGDDELEGSIGNDRLSGGAANDRLLGGPDDDTLLGASGIDRLYGNANRDLFLPGAQGADRIAGGPGRDTASFRHATSRVDVDLRSGTAMGLAVTALFGIENAVGSSFADTLRGSARDNDFMGLAGPDTLEAGGGDDDLDGGRGSDGLVGGDGRDTAVFSSIRAPVRVDLAAGSASGQGNDGLQSIENVHGSLVSDLLKGTARKNFLRGSKGGDRLLGFGGPDWVNGGAGPDRLDGGPGGDTATFGIDGEPVRVDLSQNMARGRGRDTLVRFERVVGTAANDRLRGADGQQGLFGGAGSDVLRGAAGSDYLEGGVFSDALFGGGGTDTCDSATNAQGCEKFVHVDGPPQALIEHPRLGRIFDAGPRLIRGTEIRSLAGANRIEVAVRRERRTGCQWWHSQSGSFERSSCYRRHWNTLQNARSWELRFGRRLSPGKYEAIARAIARIPTDSGVRRYVEQTYELGRNRIRFRVID